MAIQQMRLNAEGYYEYEFKTEEVDKLQEEMDKKSEAETVKAEDPKDTLTISEGGNRELAFFNFLDKGGDASKVLSEVAEKDNDKLFALKPNFLSVSTSRYFQMRTEIEHSFDDDPDMKAKFQKELDKAYDDYTKTQAKIITDVLNGEEEKAALGINEKEEVLIEDTSRIEEEIEEFKEMHLNQNKDLNNQLEKQLSYQEKMAVIEKLFSDMKSNYSDDTAAMIDDFLLNTLDRNTNDREQKILGQNQSDYRIRQFWDTVQFQVNGTNR